METYRKKDKKLTITIKAIQKCIAILLLIYQKFINVGKWGFTARDTKMNQRYKNASQINTYS